MSEIKITPLGTVSPYPKNNRNNPGFLIEYKDNKILLDCGNGITRLLDFTSCLKNLHVFITHYHLDHFSDIGALQYGSYCYHNQNMLDKPIKIYLPSYNNNYRYLIISNKESYSEYYDIDEKNSYKLDDLEVSFEDNHSHTIPSYMVKLKTPNIKIVYTSDIGTTNFDKLIEFCKDSDLLICESSLLKKHNLKSKTHFTAENAGILAKESNSNKLLLTHLWPEEDRSLYLEEAKDIFKNTSLAEEGKQLILRR